ncbi:hypothetical protein HY411_03045 [Candidatus Gottesmanbacteria bacterium]|nr:hypothetical protein [Candidatus Gottesmanbacteria bacterium]
MELLIAIAIIGILVTIAASSYATAQKKSRDSRRVADMKAIQNAFEQYYADQSSTYPTSISQLSPTYLPTVPQDPKPTNPGYQDTYPSGGYCACATLEGTTGGNATSNACAFSSSGGQFFCVKNLQ